MSSIGIEVIKIALQDAVTRQMAINDYLCKSMALVVNVYIWYRNKSHLRGALSIAGPIAVLLTLYPLWQYNWSTYLFYFGICLMVIMSVLDIVKPLKERTCKV